MFHICVLFTAKKVLKISYGLLPHNIKLHSHMVCYLNSVKVFHFYNSLKKKIAQVRSGSRYLLNDAVAI